MVPRLLGDRSFLSGAIFLVIGIAFSAGALNYKLGSASQPGPGYFPFGLGIMLAILGGILLVRVLLAADEPSKIGNWSIRPLVIIVCAVLIFALLLPRAGLLIALPVLIIMSARASEEFRWREALVSAGVITFISWLLFVQTLHLEIPLFPILSF